jgi:peptidoglycan/xylan/chitin deacetylase (PgdA/CDA1 family)
LTAAKEVLHMWFPIHPSQGSPRVAISLDLHTDNYPEDVERCDDWLREHNIRATFFIPSEMLEMEKFRAPLLRLSRWRHELGSHGHLHDQRETIAMREGSEEDIEFLADSKRRFEDFFGFQPRSFRAAYWGGLSERTVALLDRLGYLVDASATPQRLGILSSYPRQNPYVAAPRAPYHLTGRLIEIPTSAFLLPLAIPTFRTLRYLGSVIFMSLFQVEAWLNPRVIINVQLHASDFVPEGVPFNVPKRSIRDLIPRTPGGIRAKMWLRVYDRKGIASIALRLVDRLRRSQFGTLAQYYASLVAACHTPVETLSSGAVLPVGPLAGA